ncbi:MAG: ribonuclease E activity regulator RraA [Rhodobacteraceae bacterium]|uniref:ribonuclease E activity regulator RraA n=1 Tax=Albidovulum sp. TaxID=1872424 RepID=UPI001E17F67A|nr:ribonuclease E activity regulator RraA [uncultured Defluviimonas sp.]MCB2126720.1 ribonuclease E activity regulator RraA [Paracoccaceae bacterium]MCC0071045.1 ribonuclease E activity regulator RraA [Paracoccaceae bacterium]
MKSPEATDQPADWSAQASTADLFDAHPDIVRVCEAQFRSFGRHEAFAGACSTVSTFEDHRPVLAAVESDGQGRVLVVDGHGSLRVGLMGDRLAGIAARNGWRGVVIYGAIRDSAGIDQLDIGVKALGTTARRSTAPAQATRDEPVSFGSATFSPGDWVYADRDCVIVAGVRLA